MADNFVLSRTPITEPGTGALSRPWNLFFSTVDRKLRASGTGASIRTLLVKDSTIGTDIADHVVAQTDGTAQYLAGVLRIPISADLTVDLKLNGAVIASLTIPAATAVDTVIQTTTFASSPQAIAQGDVLSWDITASDGSKDAAGVASFTVLWN